MVRLGKPTSALALNEIGVFGVFLGDGSRVLLNEPAGHLVRTKVCNAAGRHRAVPGCRCDVSRFALCLWCRFRAPMRAVSRRALQYWTHRF
jgi:hypothetical protein